MLNIDRLEKRWRIYKIKSFMPQILIVLVVGVLLVVGSSFIDNSPKVQYEKTKESHIQNEILKVPEPIKEKVKPELSQKPQVKKKEIVEEKLVLSPSFDFLENIESKEKKIERKTTPIKKEKEQKKVEIKESKPILIKRENNYKDIAEVIQRFKKNNNPALSLFVAKKYYELGEYKKSYNYALITNNIDDKIEQSWIVFAKSLVKLNQTAKAKKILTEYIKNTNSNSAKMVLEDIEKGRL